MPDRERSSEVDLARPEHDESVSEIVVLVSATTEWRALAEVLPAAADIGERSRTPFGEWFALPDRTAGHGIAVLYGGWGKISAAASTQYAIDRFAPELVVNLGSCGGFAGDVERGEVLVAVETVVYDIVEQVTDADEAIAELTTTLDLSWLDRAGAARAYPSPVRPARLVSADRDIVAGQIPELRRRYGAIAADWESGAIAWTAARNRTPCLILRAVSDLVDPVGGGEVYDDHDEFARRCVTVMRELVEVLPAWLEAWRGRPAGWTPRATTAGRLAEG